MSDEIVVRAMPHCGSHCCDPAEVAKALGAAAKKRAELEAACAEYRDQLESIAASVVDGPGMILQMNAAALLQRTDAGKGWVSPAEVKALIDKYKAAFDSDVAGYVSAEDTSSVITFGSAGAKAEFLRDLRALAKKA